MKLAIAASGDMVSGHFGHCDGFAVYTIEDNKVVSKEFAPSPEHKKGAIPKFVSELGADVVVSGGMGAMAVEIFNSNGIDVITGAMGDLDEVAEAYIAGNLVSSGSICREHEHSHECGEH